MDIFADVLLGLSLAVDAFVVSLALGLKHRHLPTRWKILVPVCFGLFQGGMPLLGWLTTSTISGWLTRYDHWMSFSILLILGIRMIKQAWLNNDNTEVTPAQISLHSVLTLSVATSIDALAVGFTFPTITTQPLLTSLMIGIVTAIPCGLALLVTQQIPKHIARPAEITAGMVLIGLGCKLLLI